MYPPLIALALAPDTGPRLAAVRPALQQVCARVRRPLMPGSRSGCRESCAGALSAVGRVEGDSVVGLLYSQWLRGLQGSGSLCARGQAVSWSGSALQQAEVACSCWPGCSASLLASPLCTGAGGDVIAGRGGLPSHCPRHSHSLPTPLCYAGAGGCGGAGRRGRGREGAGGRGAGAAAGTGVMQCRREVALLSIYSLSVALARKEVAACSAWHRRAPGPWSLRNARSGAPVSAANAPQYTFAAVQVSRFLLERNTRGTKQSDLHALHLPRRLATPHRLVIYACVHLTKKSTLTRHRNKLQAVRQRRAQAAAERDVHGPRMHAAPRALRPDSCGCSGFTKPGWASGGGGASEAQQAARSVQAAQEHIAVLDLQVAHAQQNRRVAAAVARDAQPRVHVYHIEPAAPERRQPQAAAAQLQHRLGEAERQPLRAAGPQAADDGECAEQLPLRVLALFRLCGRRARRRLRRARSTDTDSMTLQPPPSWSARPHGVQGGVPRAAGAAGGRCPGGGAAGGSAGVGAPSARPRRLAAARGGAAGLRTPGR